MGREIRKDVAGWEHPKRENANDFQPMFDEDFDTAINEWSEGYEFWKKGEHPDQRDCEYWEWEGDPPEPRYYRPKWNEEEMTHFQMYETVSEGTPVSPVFETKQELVDYLVENGDFWDQRRVFDGWQSNAGWDRKNAEAFVEREWAMSGMITPSGEILTPRDGA